MSEMRVEPTQHGPHELFETEGFIADPSPAVVDATLTFASATGAHCRRWPVMWAARVRYSDLRDPSVGKIETTLDTIHAGSQLCHCGVLRYFCLHERGKVAFDRTKITLYGREPLVMLRELRLNRLQVLKQKFIRNVIGHGPVRIVSWFKLQDSLVRAVEQGQRTFAPP